MFGTPPAGVTPALQLRTAEMDAAQIRHYRFTAGENCQSLSIPAGSAFMIKTVEIDTYSNNNSSSTSTVYLYAATGCSGNSTVAEVTPLSIRQTNVIPFEPGIPIPANRGFSVRGAGGVIGAVHVTGYLMPSNAVPAGAAAAQAKGASKEASLR